MNNRVIARWWRGRLASAVTAVGPTRLRDRLKTRHHEQMPELRGSAVPVGRLRDLDQPTLQVDELTVRPFRDPDARHLSCAYCDPDIQRWHARTMTEGEAHEWITTSAARWRAETGANWAVVGDDGVLVGRVGFRWIDLTEGAAEIAYWTIPSARGRGIAAKAVRASSSWMFTQVGLHRIELNHSTANPASCRVASKAGYAYEGTRRQLVLHQDGWHDMHAHGRLSVDEISG